MSFISYDIVYIIFEEQREEAQWKHMMHTKVPDTEMSQTSHTFCLFISVKLNIIHYVGSYLLYYNTDFTCTRIEAGEAAGGGGGLCWDHSRSVLSDSVVLIRTHCS